MKSEQNEFEEKEERKIEEFIEKNRSNRLRFRLNGITVFTGYVSIMVSIALFSVPLFIATEHNEKKEVIPENIDTLKWLLQNHTLEVFSIFSAIFLAYLGVHLLGAAGKLDNHVIPKEDRKLLEPLIQSANKDAIEQYVILSSLSGFTGNFQKIGFSGLPLATVTLTIFFCILSFFNHDFIEFAKLTLGAFIGSFVQRRTDASNGAIQVRNY